ncbi:MAG: ornithine--oxo-acid transaminase [Acidobacteriia bacterium]|jgi:ornithine--oxo-acid transaminase|nr:ornithine--oxo-acid transaminase [Terriglobia bacterium]
MQKSSIPRLSSSAEELIHLAETYGAHNYHPLPVVIERGSGVWVWDVEGRRYLDCLSCYSALNQGHCHPRIAEAARRQMEKVTLTSRAFHNTELGPLLQQLAELCGMEMVLPMNSGAEAVETAIKAARKWGYRSKGVEEDRAEIIVFENNFHGRTVTIISFSTEPQYRRGFGPFTPGFRIVPYGDAAAARRAVHRNTVAILVEPIQGEAGVIVPPEGFLRELRELCTAENLLLIADEIQTGLGRTGKLFACEHEGIQPDVYVLGKALGGGFYPVSAVVASRAVLGVFEPGDHGSTFGGNPLACAIAREALRVLVEEKLPERAAEMGAYFLDGLRKLSSPHVKEIRGRGLLIGLEIKAESGPARPFCERLMEQGVLCKETHQQVIRLAPPLVIRREEIDWALERIARVLV